MPSDNNGDAAPNPPERNLHQPTLLIYTYDLDSAVGPYSFRALKMGGRKKNCFACGEGSTLTLEGIKAGSPNYEQFCSAPTAAVALPPEDRITAAAYHDARQSGALPAHILLDTREKEHFSFGSIEGAINVPFGRLLMTAAAIKRDRTPPSTILPEGLGDGDAPIFVVCRRGLDSQETVEKLKELGLDRGGERRIMDIAGGMRAWKAEVDPSFPYI
jgi:adenylyltransferase/sulfurtransferase